MRWPTWKTVTDGDRISLKLVVLSNRLGPQWNQSRKKAKAASACTSALLISVPAACPHPGTPDSSICSLSAHTHTGHSSATGWSHSPGPCSRTSGLLDGWATWLFFWLSSLQMAVVEASSLRSNKPRYMCTSILLVLFPLRQLTWGAGAVWHMSDQNACQATMRHGWTGSQIYGLESGLEL